MLSNNNSKSDEQTKKTEELVNDEKTTAETLPIISENNKTSESENKPNKEKSDSRSKEEKLESKPEEESTSKMKINEEVESKPEEEKSDNKSKDEKPENEWKEEKLESKPKEEKPESKSEEKDSDNKPKEEKSESKQKEEIESKNVEEILPNDNTENVVQNVDAVPEEDTNEKPKIDDKLNQIKSTESSEAENIEKNGKTTDPDNEVIKGDLDDKEEGFIKKETSESEISKSKTSTKTSENEGKTNESGTETNEVSKEIKIVVDKDTDNSEAIPVHLNLSELTQTESSEVSEQPRDRERQELLEKHKELLERRRAAGAANIQLQTKLAEYFRRKKADAADQQAITTGGGSSIVDNLIDYSQRYSKYLITFVEVRKHFNQQKEALDNQIAELKATSEISQTEALKSDDDVLNYVIAQSKKSVSIKTGRPVNMHEFENLLALLKRKKALVTEVRLESIKLQNDVDKIDATFKSQEDLAEGLHLIDFEQLKIENQTYNNKIEERNEEIDKLQSKISNTTQIMTHVKEKLQWSQFDNANSKQILAQTEEELNFNRDRLTRIKQSRDALRVQFARLIRSCGLLGKPDLLRNFESCMDAVANKLDDVNFLKEQTSRFEKHADVYKKKLLKDKQNYGA